MLIKCSRDDLLNKLQIVQRGTAGQTTLPILASIQIKSGDESVTLESTNLEISVKAVVEAKIEQPGTAVFPARLLTDIVRSMPPGTVEISHEDKQSGLVSVVSGKSRFHLHSQAPEDFPDFPKLSADGGLKLEAGAFQEALKKVLKAVSKDETRPILNGILVAVKENKLNLVATDSYRLALIEMDLNESIEEKSVVIPWRALDELQKVSGDGSINMIIKDEQAAFLFDRVTFVTRLLEGQFPNYRQLLPDNYDMKFKIKREEFLNAASRAALIAQRNQAIKLRINSQAMVLQAEAQDIGDIAEEVSVEGDGEVNIAFNSQYLIDGLSGIREENIILELNNAVSPGLIHGEKENGFIYLIMPMRIE